MALVGALPLSLCGAAFSGCTKPDGGYKWQNEWQEKEDPDDPSDPADPSDPDDPSDEDETTIKGKPRVVWIDAAANFSDYANSESKIASDVKKIKEVGFTHIAVDVRPSLTGVLFTSKTEHALTKVDVWESGYKWVSRTASFDYLQKFIEEGHKNGLKVFATMNTFTGGYLCPYGLGSDGILYTDSSRKGWATVINSADGLVNTMDLQDSGTDYGAKFLCPTNDEVQEYLLSLIGELAAYDIDGLILDRCRFSDDGLQSDFSDSSRSKFEAYYGKKVSSWPTDIFSKGQTQLGNRVTDIQKAWLAFRAKTIHDFIEKAAAKVHSVNPDCQFGAYVGAWYSSYYTSGVNWASPKYDPAAAGYKWASSDYKNYGYADHCDVMLIGAYASTSNIWGTGEWTMQGFCKQAGELFKGDVPYYGGPDIGNSTGFEKGGQGDLMPDIVKACINNSDGMFIFDLCHIKMYNYWTAIHKAFDSYLKTVE